MRRYLAAALLCAAAAGCNAPASTQTTDTLPKDMNVLFWNQDQRDAAFRTMETVPKVVVNTVKAGGPVYPLPAGPAARPWRAMSMPIWRNSAMPG